MSNESYGLLLFWGGGGGISLMESMSVSTVFTEEIITSAKAAAKPNLRGWVLSLKFLLSNPSPVIG